MDTTTKSDRTARSGISPRSCWQTQPVQPAHRIWERRKTPDPSGPTLGSSAHNRPALIPAGGKLGVMCGRPLRRKSFLVVMSNNLLLHLPTPIRGPTTAASWHN